MTICLLAPQERHERAAVHLLAKKLTASSLRGFAALASFFLSEAFAFNLLISCNLQHQTWAAGGPSYIIGEKRLV